MEHPMREQLPAWRIPCGRSCRHGASHAGAAARMERPMRAQLPAWSVPCGRSCGAFAPGSHRVHAFA
eukprot:63085-Chlamydomonas_euryale.AAC.2